MNLAQYIQDIELIHWALEHGFKYHYSNKQLEYPDGSLVSVHKWDSLPDQVRADLQKRTEAAPSRKEE